MKDYDGFSHEKVTLLDWLDKFEQCVRHCSNVWLDYDDTKSVVNVYDDVNGKLRVIVEVDTSDTDAVKTSMQGVVQAVGSIM